MKLDNKTAVVYGAARGIGKAFCQALLDKGAKVCFGDVLQAEGEETEKEFQSKYGADRVGFKLCDVREDSQVEALFEHCVAKFGGSVDVVVAHAGIIHEVDWQDCINTNVGGVVRAFNTARKHIARNNGGNGGAFVASSSICGLMGMGNLPVYCATKHAIVGYIRSWATEENFKAHGISTSCLCAGMTQTRFFEACTEDKLACKEHFELAQLYQSMYDPTYLLSTEEVAQGLIRLLEDDSSNGQCLRITRKNGQEVVQFEQQPI